MSLFDFADHFQIVEGELPIVVGAPHHGTRPNVDADRGTGPIALALAQRLNARAVIVSDLRRTADVNKDPTRLAFTVRAHALRYQNEMFRATPPLVIEVHGHVSGQYAIELTTGFDLDPAAPSDMRFLQKLMQLKQTLPRLLSAKIGQSPTLGIYPLDRDVLKTATDTFTFQKIRRARNLTGAEWYGLHIELNAALRTSPQAQSAVFIAALADAFAAAVQSVFDPLPAPDATIPAHVEQPDGVTALLAPRSLRVTRAPTQYVNANVVVVHPIDLETLGALDGDAVVLRHGYEELRSTITPSLTIRPNHAALPARVRRQISLGEHGSVVIGRPAPQQTANGANHNALFIASELREERRRMVWLAPVEIQRLSLQLDRPIAVQASTQPQPIDSIILKAHAALLPRRMAISHGVQKELLLSIGEVVEIKS
jgi:hypothetical protein